MGKYIHKFNTVSDFNEHRSENYIQPWVSYTSENDKMDYDEYTGLDYEMLNTPLTFEALEDQTCITFYQSSAAIDDEMPVLEIEISTDNGNTWITKQAQSYNTQFVVPTLMLNVGEKVLIRGNNSAYGYYSDSEDAFVSNCGFYAESGCYVYGNIMSLIDKNSFSTLREVTDYAFSYLFSDYNMWLDGSWLLSHPEKKLLLPAVVVGEYCYNNMFYQCTNLTTMPEISATTLSDSCCSSMFSGCTHLIKAYKLPATTLVRGCYRDMFSGCTSLTFAPELPATTLADTCYSYMFANCSCLTTAPELPAITLATSCYNNMFKDCINLTTAPELPATTLAASCYNNMFRGCTSLTTAPELPATTLVNNCYQYMFQNCTSLTTAPELPATTLASYCYQYMFQSCTSLTIAPELPATTLASNCYGNMFKNCMSLTTVPEELPATTLADYCYSNMFRGCTNLTTAPELPATTLANNCYQYMFDSCIRLNYIKAIFTTTPTTSYTNNWVRDVDSTGTFIKNANAEWDVTGNNGVPTGWTVRYYPEEFE